MTVYQALGKKCPYCSHALNNTFTIAFYNKSSIRKCTKKILSIKLNSLLSKYSPQIHGKVCNVQMVSTCSHSTTHAYQIFYDLNLLFGNSSPLGDMPLFKPLEMASVYKNNKIINIVNDFKNSESFFQTTPYDGDIKTAFPLHIDNIEKLLLLLQ